MTCRLPYIENQEVFTQQQKDALTTGHLFVMERLLTAQSLETKKPLFTPYKVGDKKFLTLAPPKTKKGKEQRDFLATVIDTFNHSNPAPLGVWDASPIHIRRMKISPKGSFSDVILVHMLDYAGLPDTAIAEDLSREEISMESFDKIMNQDVFIPHHVKSASKIEALFTKDNTELMTEVDKLYERLDKLATNLTQTGKSFSELSGAERTIHSMYKQLNNPEAVADLYSMISMFKKGNSLLNYARTRVLGNDKHPSVMERVSNLDMNSPDYYKELGKLAKLINEATEITNILAPMEAIIAQANEAGGLSFWEGYNIYKAERDIIRSIQDNFSGITSDQVDNLKRILGSEIQSKDMLIEVISNELGLKFQDVKSSVEGVLAESESENTHIIRAFQTIREDLFFLKDTLAKNHYDLTTEILYQQQAHTRGFKNAAAAEAALTEYKEALSENPDTVEPKNLRGYLTRAEMKDSLAVSKDNVNVVNAWMSDTADLNDQIGRLYHDFIQSEIHKATVTMRDIELKSQGRLRSMGLALDSTERATIENEFTQEILYLNPREPAVELTDEEAAEIEAREGGYFAVIERFGKKYRVRKGLAFVAPNSNHTVELDKAIMEASLKDRGEKVYELVKDLIPGVAISDNVLAEIEKLDDNGAILTESGLFSKNVEGKYTISTGASDRFSNPALGRSTHVNNIGNSIRRSFYKKAYVLKSPQAKNDFILRKLREAGNNGDFTIENLVEELNKKDQSDFYKFFRKNTREGSTDFNHVLDTEKAKSLFGTSTTSESAEVVGIDSDGNYRVIKLTEKDAYGRFRTSGKFANIDHIFYMTNEFQDINRDNYPESDSVARLEQFKRDNPKASTYYNYIMDTYKRGNEQRGDYQLPYNLVPFISERTTKTASQRVKDGVKDWFKGLKYQDEGVYPKFKYIDGKKVYLDKNDKPIPVDAEGKPTQPLVYIQPTDHHNDPIRELRPQYHQQLDQDTQETDLFISTFAFLKAGIEFGNIKRVEPTIPLIKNILKGNESLAIKARQTTKRDVFNNTLLQSAHNIMTKNAENSTKAILSHIDQFVYNISGEDINVKGFSAKKITSAIKGLSAFQTLGFNIVSAGTNLIMGTVNNFMMASGKSYGLSEAKMRNAYKTYGKMMAQDFATKGDDLSERGLLSQLVYYFDAQKGLKEDGRGEFKSADSKMNQALNYLKDSPFFLSTKVEHVNQITLMLAMLDSYEVVPGHTMMSFIKHEQGNAFEFDLEKASSLGLSEKDLLFKVEQFHRRLDKINKDVHGQYSRLSSNMLQRHAVLALGYQFSKWIYPGFKARFRSGRWNEATHDYVEEGYLRTYGSSLGQTLMRDHNDLLQFHFIKDFKKYMSQGGLNLAFSAGKNILARTADALTFNHFSKKDNFRKSIYNIENEVDERMNAIARSNVELGFFFHAMIMGIFVHMLRDNLFEDDEEDELLNKMLGNLELQAYRLKTDMAFFLPFIPGNFSLLENAGRRVEDVFAVKRLISTNLALANQLFHPFEQYTRGGNGYEKGDFKIMNKLNKTLFVPFYQFGKILNPDQQLSFMTMVYDN